MSDSGFVYPDELLHEEPEAVELQRWAPLRKLESVISTICAWLAGLGVTALVLITLTEVFTRNVFNAPLGWNVSFAEQYLLMAMAFFGAVTAYHHQAHIAVYSLFEKFPRSARLWPTVFAQLLVLACFVMLAIGGFQAVSFSMSIDEAPVPGMAELPLPTWWWKAIMPVGGVLGAVVVLSELIRTLGGDRGVHTHRTDEAARIAEEESK